MEHPRNISLYAAPEEAFLVNSFILETEHGIVLIDTQFLVSPAKALRQQIDGFDKPLLACLITHPHPDHFAGASVVLEGLDVPVFATQATLDGIKATEAAKRAFWTPTYQGEYPATTRFPDKIIDPGTRLTIDGLEIIVDDLGAGESSDITVLYLPHSRSLIVSDLVYNRAHPWMAEGRSQAWLHQLDLVGRRYAEATTVYPGHGGPGDLTLLALQRSYIHGFRDLVAAAKIDGKISDAEKARIVRKMTAKYPRFALANLIAFNIDGVAGEAL